MNKVFGYFNDFVKGLTGLIMGVLALGIAASLLFGVVDADGNGGVLGLEVIKNVGDVLGQVATADGGVLGLIVLLIVWGIISK